MNLFRMFNIFWNLLVIECILVLIARKTNKKYNLLQWITEVFFKIWNKCMPLYKDFAFLIWLDSIFLSDPNIPAVDHLNNSNPHVTLVVSRQVKGTFLYTYPKCGMDLVLRLLLVRPIYCWSIYWMNWLLTPEVWAVYL